jgi:hypothetical protein
VIGQIFWTVLSGVSVFVIGQLLVKFAIEPIHEYRKLCGEIADALIFYANVSAHYTDTGMPKELLDEAQRTYRRLAGQLYARAHVIRLYPVWSLVRLVPRRKDLAKASNNLIGLSNNVFDLSTDAFKAKDKYRDDIKKFLDLETGE